MAWWERAKAMWEGAGGGREVALLAYPLILAHLSFTIQTFVDRLFLTWYSPEAVAGAVTGLFAVWSIIALFTGTGEYLTTFVAQYLGAGRPERIGPAMWQGIYFSIGAGLFVAALSPLVGPAFDLAGHDPARAGVRGRVRAGPDAGGLPGGPHGDPVRLLRRAGETQAILWVNVIATLVNVVCDWLLIFGNAGFPEMGVTGAALGTILSQVVGAAIYLALILKARVPEGVPHPRGLAAGAGARPAARPVRHADGAAVLPRGRGLRGVHGDRGADRHARAGGERHRLQPEHDRVHAHGGPRDRGVLARRAATSGPTGRRSRSGRCAPPSR